MSQLGAAFLFLVSGATSLAYQVLWSRQFALIFGVTIHGIATVLCAFMAGLMLGSLLGGRLASRVRSPLRLYGILELLIGAWAAAMPWLVQGIEDAYVATSHAFETLPAARNAVRMLLALAALLVPTALMGATFPLLVRHAARDSVRLGRTLGLLYGINTLGAMLGCLGAGLFLLEHLGLRGTNLAAAAGNAAVGIAAMFLGRKVPAPVAAAATDPADAPDRRWQRAALAATFVAGFSGLAYEVLWTRVLMFFLHASAYAFALMLAGVLLGLSLGSLVAGPVADRCSRRGNILLLAAVQIGIAGFAFLSLETASRLPDLVAWVATTVLGPGLISSFPRALFLMTVQVVAVVVPTTLMQGAAFTFAVRACASSHQTAPKVAGQVYGANTCGAILGSLLVGFVLMELLDGVGRTFLVVVLLNALAGAGLALASGGTTGRTRPVARTALVLLAALVGVTAVARLDAGVFRRMFERRFGELLYFAEGAADTTAVALVGTETLRMPSLFYGDGRGVAGVNTMPDNRMVGHLPMLLHGAPRRALSICYGVGNTAWSMAIHDEVEQLVCVELSPHVLETSRFFALTNHDVLQHKKLRMVIQDGRNHLLLAREKYDVITLEPPHVNTAGVVNLFTREFYRLCDRALNPGGVVANWFSIGLTPLREAQMLVRTMAEVFPVVTVWQTPQLHSWVVLGSHHPLRVDEVELGRRMAAPDLRASVSEAGFGLPEELLAWLVLDEAGVARWTEGVPGISDDRTVVDFTINRHPMTSFGIYSYTTGHALWTDAAAHGMDGSEGDLYRVCGKSRSSAESLLRPARDAAARQAFLARLEALRVQRATYSEDKAVLLRGGR
jgi:spermidine synthase